MTTTDSAISVRGLKKTYKASGRTPPKDALKGIDLDIPRGSLFGLLGPNGAGKSTFINILAGLVNKTAGSANIWGFDIDEHPRNAKASIGVVPQELFIDAFFTPFETLEVQAGLYGIPKNKRRTDEILKIVQLEEQKHAYSRTLSGGMKRRLLVAKAMVHSPAILVLDEPTAGVDVELRQQLWASVRELHKEGVTVVLTTHYLEEAEELCDRVAIINHGEVVACEGKDELLARIDEKEVVIDLAHPIEAVPGSFHGLNSDLAAPDQIRVHLNKSTTSMADVLAAVSAAGLEVRDLSTRETDLEDVFLQLTRN